MSKQSESKHLQLYTPKAPLAVCMNCDHYRCDKVKAASWGGSDHYLDKNLRCGLGGFAVKKMGTCNEFSAKPVAE